VAAYADLGGLGTKQGPPAAFVWKMPNLVPLLLPWLAVLVLLALPSNRHPRAWWIWAPLLVVALLGAGLNAAAEEANEEVFTFAVQAAAAAGFGLAVLWLLGAALARRRRALAIALAALAFAAVSLLALLVSPVSEMLAEAVRWESMVCLYLPLFWLAGGVVFAGALNLAGRLCRRRPSRVRISLWLPLWLWVLWIVAVGLVNCVAKLVSGERLDWTGLLVAPIILALVSFVTILPFLILSFTNAFYRERLKDLLRLPAAVAAPPIPVSPPATAGETVKP
jgi:hypothetical protein